MIVKKLVLILVSAITVVCTLTTTSGCAPSIRGKVSDDTTRTKTSQELPQTSDVSEYRGPKLRVGVVNFLNKTPSKVLGIGEAASDILGTILQKTDRFIVIPQQDIESILAQQRMGATGIINPETAAEMGKVLGLNAIVTGAVTAYSEAEEGTEFIVGKSKTNLDVSTTRWIALH